MTKADTQTPALTQEEIEKIMEEEYFNQKAQETEDYFNYLDQLHERGEM